MLAMCAVVLSALLTAADAGPDSIPVLPDSVLACRIVEDALSCLGAPYVYGGTGPGGFDCSGLVFRVFADNGLTLPRTAGDMRDAGAGIGEDDLLPGDLVFFDDPGHVGIYLGNGQFIHSSSYQDRGVVITSLDQPGYARRYACARRVIPALSGGLPGPDSGTGPPRGLTPGTE